MLLWSVPTLGSLRCYKSEATAPTPARAGRERWGRRRTGWRRCCLRWVSHRSAAWWPTRNSPPSRCSSRNLKTDGRRGNWSHRLKLHTNLSIAVWDLTVHDGRRPVTSSAVPTWVLHVSSEERVQHRPHQAGHAAVQDDRPLRVGHVQVVDQQALCYIVSHAHRQPTDEAGDQSDGSHSSVCPWRVKEETYILRVSRLHSFLERATLSTMKLWLVELHNNHFCLLQTSQTGFISD